MERDSRSCRESRSQDSCSKVGDPGQTEPGGPEAGSEESSIAEEQESHRSPSPVKERKTSPNASVRHLWGEHVLQRQQWRCHDTEREGSQHDINPRQTARDRNATNYPAAPITAQMAKETKESPGCESEHSCMETTEETGQQVYRLNQKTCKPQSSEFDMSATRSE
ncbi:hypothetical protein AOLI_G00099800 [Acnodon oligacanthus]